MFIRTPDEMPDNFEISKGCFVGSKEILDQVEPTLREKFSKNLYIVRADDHFLECLHPNVNKGNGLKELGEKIGITPDEMIAFGDERTIFQCLILLVLQLLWAMEAKKQKIMRTTLPRQMIMMGLLKH